MLWSTIGVRQVQIHDLAPRRPIPAENLGKGAFGTAEEKGKSQSEH